jgi:DNA replication protein DnaC
MELPIVTCKKCGREYQRHECPYCLKEQRWNQMTLQQQLPGLTPRMYKNLEQCTSFNEEITPRSCFCFGLATTGKTTFAVQMLYEKAHDLFIHNKQRKILIIKMSDLQDELLRSDKSYEVLDKYKQIDWLFIDDLGVDKNNEWFFQKIYSLIDYRYEYLLPTLITSNMDLLTLAKKFGDARITRRIATMCEQIKFTKVWHKNAE